MRVLELTFFAYFKKKEYLQKVYDHIFVSQKWFILSCIDYEICSAGLSSKHHQQKAIKSFR